MKRVFVVAEYSYMRTIVSALRHAPGLQAVGGADSRKTCRARLLELQPDVVLVDDKPSPDHALARLREASNLLPDAKRVLLTESMKDDWLEQAFDAGADAAASKKLQPVALGTLLRETVHSNIVHRFRRIRPADGDQALTSREVEILALVARGYTNGRIAYELCIAEQTVKFHLSNTYRKLGVANRTEASRYAYPKALPPPEVQLAS
jgi:DNA-binding NarL/FixJ family response regulator